ncbi:MAG: HAMP domain-containing histidine kinase [Lachnospiraceae bacterium]|nr:HAMP domain-containing histidine kinase [Lachnospiraceae bacterium]
MKQQKVVWWQPLIVMILLAVFFVLLFYVDNKYQTSPPYGKSGIITLNEQDLKRNPPVFLIDGWLLSDDRVTDQPTYIGEFSNLQRGDLSVSPHGKACYRMTLRYEGTPQIVSVDFPELSSAYVLSLNGTQLTEGIGSGRITFLLTEGDHTLMVETSSKAGYYSGMYFPPAISTEETLLRVSHVQGFAYALAFMLPLALSVFTLFLWQSGGKLSRWFALLCCCYTIYMFRYFVFAFDMPVTKYWFLAQSLSLYCLCFSVVQLTILACGADSSKVWRWLRAALLLLSALLFLLCLLIPVLPWAVFVHGRLMDFYYIVTFFTTAFFTVRGIKKESWESRYTLTGCLVFGSGLFVNLFFSNRFEPIRFFWQFEWCGLLLVILFGAMMVSRSRRILRENDMLTNHLEEQVKKRTEEVTQLLNERKAFFSDMAHDLKAPVFATQSFIEAIRKSGVGVDTELQGYLDQAQAKQWEMARRLQGLSAINTLDRIEGERVRISVKEILSEIYSTYHGEAEVQSVHLIVEPPGQDVFLMAQPQKLDILFENLIYNALRATPRDGHITISARMEGDKICMIVEDTGCGIPEEELSLVFKRFYVGANNKENGTGLGLYIVHGIVTELGGTIDVSSTVGKGTKFIMYVPSCGYIR